MQRTSESCKYLLCCLGTSCSRTQQDFPAPD